MFTELFKLVTNKKKPKDPDSKGFILLIDKKGKYFNELDAAYINSPTATMAILKFFEYCVPPGLIDEYQDLWKKIVNDYIRYGYYLIHIEYNLDFEPVKYTYRNPRYYVIKDKDDNENASTFLNLNKGTVYPVFNSDPKVLQAQFASKGFDKFLGQIYMYNDSSQPYRITPMYSVLDYMKIEHNSSTYVSKGCDNAMFGNSIFIVKRSSSASEKEIEIIDSIKTVLSTTKSVNEAGQNLMIEYEGDLDDVSKLISKVSISNDLDMDQLNGADDKAQQKICVACYGFPLILISQSEGVFGNSGEAIQVATDLWAKTCQREAANILDGFKKLGFVVTKKDEPVIEELSALDDKTMVAQAALKGSVGGVQALLSVQASYSLGNTDFESAIAILQLLFGFTRDESVKLLGQPKIKNQNDTIINPNNTGA
tara:strand:- start:748 stop:2022 length:1275 start_codon:yes stop_codon:yes gene_type:complete